MVSDGGRPKIGYNRTALIDDIEQFLGYDNTTDAVLIGAGKLGQALLGYSGFDAYGLNILAAFDVCPPENKGEAAKPIFPISDLQDFCRANKVLMGIITVPVKHAQAVCDQLISCGIKAIWNFAHMDLTVPDDVVVENVHLSDSLMRLSYRVSSMMDERERKEKERLEKEV
jgi:redox-sensing transcriptional repressor